MTTFASQVKECLAFAKSNGFEISEKEAARVVRAGNSLSKKKAEISASEFGKK